jgi:hypothetical protein
MESGAFNVQVYSSDNKANSKTTEIKVFINAIEIILNETAIGYMIDYNSDGVYDELYNYKNKEFSIVIKLFKDKYLIDLNNDGFYDYIYDSEDGDSESYSPKSSQKVEDEDPRYIIPWLFFLFLIILRILLPYRKRGKKALKDDLKKLRTKILLLPKLKSDMYRNKKRKTKSYMIKEKSYNKDPEVSIKDIEDFIDDLPDI